ncbi:ATP-binding cassette subfamily G member 4-like [Neodiprion fabricii]|uniref:ATP-binding cassette subfamily G member 4-like n=1 Tax=Neodiprion fabricii TaxID=2872261 RepID=UPI001ED95539|nr:ATP-binding cassette subfamily G member 4-like [Neodiprion fabricii]
MTQNDFKKLSEAVGGLRRPADLRLDLNIKPKNSSSESPTSPRISRSIDLGFTDVSYAVRTGILNRGRRELLKTVSGNFKAGELTAIMGPSGAGKSTLMDVLAGFTTSAVTGQVTVNGQPRNLATFRRASAYIMQEDNIQPLLTAEEAMHVAAELKLNLCKQDKTRRVEKILVALGLDEARHVLSGRLSGGQRKRLAIALELISNPPVMFFDEPTSGLDSVTSKQCIGLLKALAREGRTVICTIHQPSALLFDMIDHLYVVAQGYCLYTGGTSNMVSYLAEQGLCCPEYHNPADFILEVSAGDYGNFVPLLSRGIKNGSSNKWRSPAIGGLSKIEEMIASGLTTPVRAPRLPPTPILHMDKPEKDYHQITGEYATSFWKQLYVLLKRNVIRLSRDKFLTFTRISMHLLIALLVGTLYYQIGQDAAYVFDNFNLLFFSIMFLMFSAFNSTIITFPSELPIVMREHFNRWYKLRSFYLANKLADFPVQIIAASTFTLVVFFMSGQLPEIRRLLLYVTMCIVVSFVAQTVGLILGIGMDIRNGVIFGPLVILPFMIFSGFFVHINDAHPYMQWLFHISFLKYGFEGVMVAIYGYDRPKLDCSIVYCHYKYPRQLLKEVDMTEAEYWSSISILIGLYFALEVIAYIALRIRLKHRW